MEQKLSECFIWSCWCDDESAMRMVLIDTSVKRRQQRFAQSYVAVRLIYDQRKEVGQAWLNQGTWRFEMYLTSEDD
jgi:hypothetical protein